ncbi:MFS transporter [Streptomyces sp. NPDC007945]|uniref:MFS transporter n=1 Tax=Streptomyces sp. NPDC007945 TaxID=3364797 RepID=UPI0036E6A857
MRAAHSPRPWTRTSHEPTTTEGTARHVRATGNKTSKRPLVTVLAANAISIAGNSLTLIGVPWFALETTGSPGKAGFVAFCAALPVVLSAVAGGPLVDRIGRRRVSVASDLVCGLALAAIPLLHHTGHLTYGLLCALMAVNGLFHAPGETARHVLVPHLAERAGTPLARAASLYDAVSRGARMGGAALAGVLVATAGAETVLLFDAGTFTVSALLVAHGLRGVPAAEPRRDGPRLSAERYRTDLREGYAYLFGDRLMLGITLLVMVTNGLSLSWSSVLLPLHAREHLGGPAAQGLLVAVFAGCALAAALLYGAVGHRFPRRAVFTTGFLLTGAPLFVVAATTETVAPLLVTAVVAGLGAGVLNPVLTTVMYERVPEALRTRVAAASTAGVLMATPLGGLVTGLVVEAAGLTATLLGVAALYFLVTLAPAVFPTWRAMDEVSVSSSGPSTPGPARVPAASPPRR